MDGLNDSFFFTIKLLYICDWIIELKEDQKNKMLKWNKCVISLSPWVHCEWSYWMKEEDMQALFSINGKMQFSIYALDRSFKIFE